ncbi:MAG: hypothetical protein JWN09_76 [Microbacteriaceae bacterium]|jgi:hypothetical protein|nr:hypothetical protein [Microbacteriaceae bacterium]
MTDDATTDAAIERVIDDESRVSRSGPLGWLGLTIAILFGLFYAYDLFEAISNVAVLPGDITAENTVRAAVGLGAANIPWAILIADLLISPVVYVAAFLLGRRRSVFIKIVCFFVGLSVVAAVSLTLVALV